MAIERSRANVTYDLGKPLPKLTCLRADLPDLSESWAWAHAQVSGTKTAAQALLGVPEQNLSRLLCPARLKQSTAYLACVVPAFEAGRLAGLGLAPAGAATLAPAWLPPAAGRSATVELPIYYRWEFATAPAGGFHALASRIQPRKLDVTLGLREIDLSEAYPDLGLGYGVTGSVLGMLGAVAPVGAADQPPPQGIWDTAARTAFQQKLAAELPGAITGLPLPL